MKFLVYISFMVFLFVVISCGNNDDQVFCTEEFRTIAVTIPNTPLSDYYTLRNSTNDTIRIGQENILGNFTYPILDDNYKSNLTNSQDVFTFVGLIDEEIVITETYIIMADKCHVDLVSGRTEIIL